MWASSVHIIRVCSKHRLWFTINISSLIISPLIYRHGVCCVGSWDEPLVGRNSGYNSAFILWHAFSFCMPFRASPVLVIEYDLVAAHFYVVTWLYVLVTITLPYWIWMSLLWYKIIRWNERRYCTQVVHSTLVCVIHHFVSVQSNLHKAICCFHTQASTYTSSSINNVRSIFGNSKWGPASTHHPKF